MVSEIPVSHEDRLRRRQPPSKQYGTGRLPEPIQNEEEIAGRARRLSHRDERAEDRHEEPRDRIALVLGLRDIGPDRRHERSQEIQCTERDGSADNRARSRPLRGVIARWNRLALVLSVGDYARTVLARRRRLLRAWRTRGLHLLFHSIAGAPCDLARARRRSRSRPTPSRAMRRFVRASDLRPTRPPSNPPVVFAMVPRGLPPGTPPLRDESHVGRQCRGGQTGGRERSKRRMPHRSLRKGFERGQHWDPGATPLSAGGLIRRHAVAELRPTGCASLAGQGPPCRRAPR